LAVLKRPRQLAGDPRILLEHGVLDDDAVIDRVDAGPAEIVERGVAGIGNERLDLGRFDAYLAKGGVDRAGQQQVLHRLAAETVVHIRRRLEFQNVFVVGRNPGDLVQVDAILGLQDAARPQPGGDGVAAVDPDLPALQSFGVRMPDFSL
jgi:hypothetical protein